MNAGSEVGSMLNDEILRMLVRFFRSGEKVELSGGTLRLADDLEYLRIQWRCRAKWKTWPATSWRTGMRRKRPWRQACNVVHRWFGGG